MKVFHTAKDGKSKILKNYTAIFVSDLSTRESTIPKAIVIVKITKNCTEVADKTIRSEKQLKR
jgi:hypothetical protein